MSLSSRALVALFCTGCVLHQIHEDQRERREGLWVLRGNVTVEQWSGAPVVVSILRAPEHEGMPFAIVDYEQLFEPGPYRFFVDPGRYRLAAFVDQDRNVDLSADERVGAYAGFIDVELAGGGERVGLDIAIGLTPQPQAALPLVEQPTGESRSLFVGAVASLDDARFDPANARMGVYEPLRFMREVGAGIFLLEPYDPARVPVIYVHGIGGHPREMRELIAGLDRSRFQPWVAQYPSGWDLAETAEFYLRVLNELASVHELDRVCIVAHSMGGLLTRAMIERYREARPRPYLRGLITLASPLGGHPAAAQGAAVSPEVVPAWRSLVPSGPFVQHLYDRPLPDEIGYALLFAFDGEHAGDGVVPLTSQLRPEAQSEADLVRGFQTTHTGILRLESALAVVSAALDRCASAPAPEPPP